jgi:hypothetical protein
MRDLTLIILLVIMVEILFGAVTAWIMERKRWRKLPLWFLMGMCLNVIGVLIAWQMPHRRAVAGFRGYRDWIRRTGRKLWATWKQTKR